MSSVLIRRHGLWTQSSFGEDKVTVPTSVGSQNPLALPFATLLSVLDVATAVPVASAGPDDQSLPRDVECVGSINSLGLPAPTILQAVSLLVELLIPDARTATYTPLSQV